jgi:hypothetical protein
LLYALAGPIMVLLYGEEFRSGAQYLQVLSWILPIQGDGPSLVKLFMHGGNSGSIPVIWH